MNFVLDCLLRTSIVTIAVWLATLLFRRRSAAFRHWLWLGALSGFVIVPVLRPLASRAPAVRVSLRPAETLGLVSPAARTSASALPGQPAVIRSATVAAAIWAAGSFLLCMRRVRAVWRMNAIAKRTLPGPAGWDWENVRISQEIRVPLTCGLLRPIVLLPAYATGWSTSRLSSVLAHEMEHVRRHDAWSHWFAEAVCAVWWFHPLAWLARRRASEERECACDDAVLLTGSRPSDYANDLLEIVSKIPHKGEQAMALSAISSFERRLRALLLPGVDRARLEGRTRLTLTFAMAAILVPLALVRAQAPAGQGDLLGTVSDASRARVPHALVIASGTGGNREVTRTDESGSWSLEGIPAGNYSIEVRAPGFALSTHQVNLSAGQRLAVDDTLQLGTVQVTLNIVGRGQARRSTSDVTETPNRIRVGGNVQATRLIRQVKPAYPETARAQGIEGTVVMIAVIGKDGALLSLAVVNKLADPDLAAAAMDAVQQWHYQPTLLNGRPVEVVTTITINFALQE